MKRDLDVNWNHIFDQSVRQHRERRFAVRNKPCKTVTRISIVKKRMARGFFGIIDANHNHNISQKEIFKPFSTADTNYDFKVSQKEFSQYMNKMKKPICQNYIREKRRVVA